MKKVDSAYLRKLCFSSRDIFSQGFQKVRDLGSKGVDNPVTETDLAVQDLLHRLLLEDGFLANQVLAEEREQIKQLNFEELWIIDPLDGTMEFLEGVPEFAVSLALYRAGKLEAGAVYNPMTSFLATCSDSEKFSFSGGETGTSRFSSGHVLCSRSEWKKGLFVPFASELSFYPVGSIAYKLALLAAGKAKAVVTLQPKNAWDVAAGFALVRSVGGIITDLQGRELLLHPPFSLIKEGFLASLDSNIHSTILKFLN